MSIAKFNARALLDLGLDRPTVLALQHILTQTGNEVGARTLPSVATQTAQIPAIVAKTDVLDLRASLLANVAATNIAADVTILSLPMLGILKAGMTVRGQVIGQTSNGTTPGTLSLWLAVDGVKVFTQAFTTPEQVGADKGFAADFVLTVRTPGAAMAAGVLHLAYNAPTVLPAVANSTFAVPDTGAVFALGMNWSAANLNNAATVKIAVLSVDKL